jgi:RIO-like serine/threonine protein kinase
MENRLDLQVFTPEFKPVHLGSRVWRVSRDKTAKIVLPSDLEELEREFRIASLFYENGIAVPKPFGIHLIPIETSGKMKECPGYLREYLAGVPLSILRDAEFERAVNSYSREIEKAEKLGYDAWDLHWDNGLWVPKEKRTYLIDLDSFGNEGEDE